MFSGNSGDMACVFGNTFYFTNDIKSVFLTMCFGKSFQTKNYKNSPAR